MMRTVKTILVALILVGLIVPLFGCSTASGETKALENQVATVQRGDLTVDITAAGNLALSRTEDLAFEIAGTVEEVLVEEGDFVKEGQVLAKLDTSAWEDNLATLADKLTAAERQLTTKKREVTRKERELTAAERQLEIKKRSVLAKERDVLQVEINLKNTEIALAEAQDSYTWPELEVAQAEVDKLKAYLQYALDGQRESGSDGWSRLVTRLRAELDAAEKKLNAMLTGADPEEVGIKKVEVAIARGKLEEAQEAVKDALIAVEDAQKDIEDAQIAVEDAWIAVEDAQKDVADAKEALDEALDISVEIIAPFDGFITKVNVKGGDEVKTGTVAVQLADPNKFEANILVGEMDILKTKLGGQARVQVDAMPGLSLPAKVTHISPTATIQSGVVNYKVKVEVQSLEAVLQKQPQTMRNFSSGELPERIKQAIEEGRITQEQAEEMMKQRQQGQETQQGQMSTMLSENFQLREGLTVTVSIIVAQKSNVLLVPNTAITQQGAESYVKVSQDGIIEEREIKTGLSDWQFTEIIEGLNEGEKVIVPQGAITTGTTSQPGQRPPGVMIPGMGRMLR